MPGALFTQEQTQKRPGSPGRCFFSLPRLNLSPQPANYEQELHFPETAHDAFPSSGRRPLAGPLLHLDRSGLCRSRRPGGRSAAAAGHREANPPRDRASRKEGRRQAPCRVGCAGSGQLPLGAAHPGEVQRLGLSQGVSHANRVNRLPPRSLYQTASATARTKSSGSRSRHASKLSVALARLTLTLNVDNSRWSVFASASVGATFRRRVCSAACTTEKGGKPAARSTSYEDDRNISSNRRQPG